MENPVAVVLGLPHTDYAKGVGGLGALRTTNDQENTRANPYMRVRKYSLNPPHIV